MTYKEGIANALRLLYAPQKERKYWEIFRDNGFLFVEKAAPAPTSGVSPDIWLYNQLQAANVPETPLPADLASQLRREIREDYAHYRFRDLPPRFLAHNEYVIAMVISKYVEHVSENRFFEAIEDANAVLFQASGSGFAVLMEIWGSPARVSRSASAGHPDPRKPATKGGSDPSRTEPPLYAL